MIVFSQLDRSRDFLFPTGSAIRFSVRQSHDGSARPVFDVDNYGEKLKTMQKNAAKTAHLWIKVFWIAMVPGTLLSAYLARKEYEKEMEHLKHRKQEDYIAYPYLATRTKPFPWGDGNKGLFHNPYTNWVPGVGYEKLMSEEKDKKH